MMELASDNRINSDWELRSIASRLFGTLGALDMNTPTAVVSPPKLDDGQHEGGTAVDQMSTTAP